jgi:hypothetical protein
MSYALFRIQLEPEENTTTSYIPRTSTPMTKLDKLNSEFLMASKEVARIKVIYLAKKRELVEIETELVNAKESEYRARERYETFRDTLVIESSREDERHEEIAGYMDRKEASMKSIENEAPLERVWSGSLDVSKPKT